MCEYKYIDLNTWPRTQLFDFYRNFDNACFNVTVSVLGENIYRYSHDKGYSFFQMCLYSILRAANRVPQIRQRLIDGRPVEYDKISVMTPIMTKYDLFHQVLSDYYDSFDEFAAEITPKIENARNSKPYQIVDCDAGFICASCLPWLHFDSVSQADLTFGESQPVLAWGKMEDGKIPISVKLNHCFIDGIHVARFFDEITKGFSNPESLLIK